MKSCIMFVQYTFIGSLCSYLLTSSGKLANANTEPIGCIKLYANSEKIPIIAVYVYNEAF